jgi:PelA/Pel-15E family pectate lyase
MKKPAQISSTVFQLFFTLICLAFSVSAQIQTTPANSTSGAEVYLFAHFKNNGEDGLHLALSRDGLQWRTLNEDKPYLTPAVGSQKLMRDPCIIHGPDGIFHMVWTTGWRGQDIGIAHSRDLINWSEQKAIPVMAHETTAMNCWAPEIFYDAEKKQYLIFWSTTIPGRFPESDTPGNNGLNHRIYYVTTKDFVTYSKAALLYNDGFNVIDATIVKHAGKYVMILKDETASPVRKNLRIATSDQLAGPYSRASEPFTADWVEGPTALQIKGEWIVYYDMYRDHRYGAMKSADLKTWQDISPQLRFPEGARHGTIFSVSEKMLPRLLLGWNDAQRQRPEWYGGESALRIADNVLLYQRETGGWPKNINMALVLSEQSRNVLLPEKKQTDSTLDNGATVSQMIYLARVYNATRQNRFQESFLKGLDYLLKAQYENGGWPQSYPDLSGYARHITFNDNAMRNVLTLLQNIAKKQPEYLFVDEARRQKSAAAVNRGIDCILKTQIVVNNKKTAWCAQHDSVTLAPAEARSYEKISLSGSESVGITRFLMSIDKPSPQIIEAVQSAIAWFESARVEGLRLVRKPDASGMVDRIVVPDASAPPMWARFYDIATNRPIFCGRDGIIKYSLAEIEHERRNNYRWYVEEPLTLLEKDFPEWKKKLGNTR